MASTKLPNKLRMYRKRSGFSQQEIGFLLGHADGSQLSRYERFYGLPALRTAFALAVIFRVSVRDLFPGEHETTEDEVIMEARLLQGRLGRKRANQFTSRKRTLLASVISGADKTE
jgi:transcriptional regulator with XRE-family HTH domain